MAKIILNGESFDLRGQPGPDGNPIGTIVSFMGMAAPKDYLICDGSVYKISDYPDLAAFFKQQFGSETYFGGSNGTFTVPDMRNLFLRGYHGEASEQLSGEIGKKQDGTIFPDYELNRDFGVIFAGINNNTYAIQEYDSKSNIANRCVYTNNGTFAGTADSGVLTTARPVNMAVLYCIKAVKSESERRDDGQVYSTDEVRIGTWTDGKPLYRKVVNIRTPSEALTGTNIVKVENVDTVLNIYGGYKSRTGSLIPISFIISETDNILAVWMLDGYIRMYVSSNYTNINLHIVIEYTKTTDVGQKSIIQDSKNFEYELPKAVTTASSAVTYQEVNNNA